MFKIIYFLKVTFAFLKIYPMPRWLMPLLILTLLIIAVEIYTFQAFKTISKSKLIRFSFLAVNIGLADFLL
jgi:hypothetical protein